MQQPSLCDVSCLVFLNASPVQHPPLKTLKVVPRRKMFFEYSHRGRACVFPTARSIVHCENHFFGLTHAIERFETFDAQNALELRQKARVGIQIRAKNIEHVAAREKRGIARKDEDTLGALLAPIRRTREKLHIPRQPKICITARDAVEVVRILHHSPHNLELAVGTQETPCRDTRGDESVSSLG